MTFKDDLNAWFDMQPAHVPYTRVRDFIANYKDVNNAEAEVEMAKLARSDKIKVVETHKASNPTRRVFSMPLDDLIADDVKTVFSSVHTERKIESVARQVHDITGHDVNVIMDFIREHPDTRVSGSTFKWQQRDLEE